MFPQFVAIGKVWKLFAARHSLQRGREETITGKHMKMLILLPFVKIVDVYLQFTVSKVLLYNICDRQVLPQQLLPNQSEKIDTVNGSSAEVTA